MPRDAATTRESLISAGRALLARENGLSTPVKQIVEAAGQRNVSALHYHFGGRDGLVDTIVRLHNDRIEAARAPMLDALGPDATLRQLVEAVVLPQAELLDERDGRQFLSIVSQLVDLLHRWDETADAAPPQARRAFLAIQDRLPPGLPPALRRERITRFMELVGSALGARSRQVDSRHPPTLSTGDFVANLVEMAVGALAAPVPRPPAPPASTPPASTPPAEPAADSF